MGFASMLEEIREKLGDELPIIIGQETVQERTLRVEDPVASYQALRSAHLQAAYRRELPRRFVDTVTPMLEEDGIPSYLHQLFLGWIYDLMRRHKSAQETWQEFAHLADGLVIEHLNEGDQATAAFVRRFLFSSPEEAHGCH